MLHVQPLLCDRRINNGVMQRGSRQRIGRHVLAATKTNTTAGLLLETVSSTRSVQSGYKEDNGATQLFVSCRLRVEFFKGGGEEMAL
jgi:hypothetical protein